jgi:RND family efflux transporter MFP subunit
VKSTYRAVPWVALFLCMMLPAAHAAAPAETSASFLVTADRETPLSAAMPGRVARILVGLGDTVKKGDLLVSLDCSDIDARRASAKAEYDAAQLRYQAKAKLQGLQSAAELEVELAASDVNRTQGQMRIFAAQLAQCRFIAPFDGRVAKVHVKEGQGVAAGAPVIDLVGTGTPKARLNVPSRWVAWMQPGSHLRAVVDETGASYVLTVSRISGRVDAVSQTIEIEATFAGDTGRVLPGMTGRAVPESTPAAH